MCHNSGIEKGEQQIERYMAFGMPSRAVKSVKYTMRKREKQQQKKEQQKQLRQKQHQQEQYLEELELSSSSSNTSSSSSSTSYSDSEDSGTDSTSMQQLAIAEAAQMFDTEPEVTEPVTVETVTNSAAAVAVIATAEQLTLTETTHNPKGNSMDNSNSSSSNSNNNSEIFKIPKMCGRFRKLQQQQQQQPEQQVEDIAQLKAQQQRKLSSMEPSMDDALAIGTQMTRKVSDRIACLVAQLQGSRLYTILTRTTQPAHLIAICILAFVLMTVGRDLIEGSPATTPTTTTTRTLSSSSSPTRGEGSGGGGGGTLPNLIYLGAFATHFGSQIWMTFVSGLSLYFSLPRHIFGQCQQILFPRYFAFNAVLSLTMLVTYAKYFLSGWTTASGIQVGSLALAAGIEVVVRLYLVPPMLKLMHEKYKIEDAIGSGQEVGSLVQGDLIDCPHYQRIHKGFRRIHMTIAIGNMTVMLATCLQLYFLASKIHLS